MKIINSKKQLQFLKNYFFVKFFGRKNMEFCKFPFIFLEKTSFELFKNVFRFKVIFC